MTILGLSISGRFLLLVLVLGAVRAGAEDSPYYAKYKYGSSAAEIDFGPVITAVPNAVVAEVIRRDRILREGLGRNTLRYHPLDKGPDAVALMLDGKLDATLQSDITMLELAAAVEITNVALFKENFGVVVARKGQAIAELRGKRVGTPGGGAGHFTLLQALDQAGLRDADIVPVRMEVRDMPAALLAGRIDAFSAFEPAPSTVLLKHGDRYAAIYRHRSPGYLIVTRKIRKENPEAVTQLAAALARAVNWLRRDRNNLQRASEWAAQAIATFKGPQLTVKEIMQMTRSSLLELREVPQMARPDAESNSLIARNFRFLKEHGRLPASAEWNSVHQSFDFGVMSEVLSNRKRYRIDTFDYEMPVD